MDHIPYIHRIARWNIAIMIVFACFTCTLRAENGALDSIQYIAKSKSAESFTANASTVRYSAFVRADIGSRDYELEFGGYIADSDNRWMKVLTAVVEAAIDENDDPLCSAEAPPKNPRARRGLYETKRYSSWSQMPFWTISLNNYRLSSGQIREMTCRMILATSQNIEVVKLNPVELGSSIAIDGILKGEITRLTRSKDGLKADISYKYVISGTNPPADEAQEVVDRLQICGVEAFDKEQQKLRVTGRWGSTQNIKQTEQGTEISGAFQVISEKRRDQDPLAELRIHLARDIVVSETVFTFKNISLRDVPGLFPTKSIDNP